MLSIPLVISLDRQEHVEVTWFTSPTSSTVQNVFKEISPASAAPLQELLSLDEVQDLSEMSREDIELQIETTMHMSMKEMEISFRGLLFILVSERNEWAKIFLSWGQRGIPEHHALYQRLVRTLSLYQREFVGD